MSGSGPLNWQYCPPTTNRNKVNWATWNSDDCSKMLAKFMSCDACPCSCDGSATQEECEDNIKNWLDQEVDKNVWV